jgi:hypothetical protein
MIAAAVGATVVDPAAWLCDEAQCPATDDMGRPLYKDDSHLRASVARERFAGIDQYVYVK